MKKMKLFIAFLLSMSLLVGCGNQNNNDDPIESDCYVSFEELDEYYDYPVDAYGEEFELPEPKGDYEEGSFIGWIGQDGLYKVGDKVVAEEFMTFTALCSNPEQGTLVCIDSIHGGIYTASGTEELYIDSPYNNYDDSSSDDFFDYWQDDKGNTYQGGESITVENGNVLILDAIYSTDFSNAYKVNVYCNTGDEDFDFDFYRYVKKGASIPLELRIEPNGKVFDGWYDAAQGGNLISSDIGEYTPTSDISLYAHWIDE